MKKLIFIILSLVVNTFQAITQSCLPDGITFATQSQIDSFPINYPNCTEIEGNVWIEGEDINNLIGLNALTIVWGNLIISGNYLLNSLVGLENLIKIDGRLYIAGNPISNFLGLNNLAFIGEDFTLNGNNSLINFEGLENLTSMNGDFFIHFNNSLTSLNGLNFLTNIDGYFKISYNHSLTNLAGLDNLTHIGGYLEIAYTGLTNLIGLDNLSTIGGYLLIQGNNDLVDFSGLENLNTIQENLWIYDNQALISLSGPENLNFVGGDISISSNMQLTSLDGLDNIDPNSINNLDISRNFLLATCNIQSICDYLLSPAGSVNIYQNDDGCNNPNEVASACGFSLPCLPYGNYHLLSQSDIDEFQSNYPGCNELGGNTYIMGFNIENLNGLTVINSIEGSLRIEYNSSLINLTGLDNLASIGNELRIHYNSSLTDVSNLINLTSVGGTLMISDNQLLPNLNGLENISFLGGDLIMFSNSSLPNLNSFLALTEIGGNLQINNLNKLKNIDGLNNVTSIGGIIEIRINDSLTSLNGINNINEASIEELTISYNSSLSMCEVQSVCNYLANPNGTVYIYGNAPGCNSVEEIQAACDSVYINEIDFEDLFTISPNPCNYNTKLQFESKEKGLICIEVYEISGLMVKQIETNVIVPGNQIITVDLTDISNGVYFLILRSKEVVQTKKLIIF